MSNKTRAVVIAALAVGLCSTSLRAGVAAITVFGNGMAKACSVSAYHVAAGVIPTEKSVEACDLALSTESLSLHDLAGTHVNRGVLLLARSKFLGAKRDFDAAIKIMPDLGEAYTDRGAASLGLQHYAEAVADIDHGLTLNPGEPEKAYYNRGLAHEGLDDLKSAYLDYTRAAELKPDWDAPKKELSRFTVAQHAS